MLRCQQYPVLEDSCLCTVYIDAHSCGAIQHVSYTSTMDSPYPPLRRYNALTCVTPHKVNYMELSQVQQASQPSSLLNNLSRLLSSTGSLTNHSRMGTLVRALWMCCEADLTSLLSCKASLL